MSVFLKCPLSPFPSTLYSNQDFQPINVYNIQQGLPSNHLHIPLIDYQSYGRATRENVALLFTSFLPSILTHSLKRSD